MLVFSMRKKNTDALKQIEAVQSELPTIWITFYRKLYEIFFFLCRKKILLLNKNTTTSDINNMKVYRAKLNIMHDLLMNTCLRHQLHLQRKLYLIYFCESIINILRGLVWYKHRKSNWKFTFKFYFTCANHKHYSWTNSQYYFNHLQKEQFFSA